MHEADPDAARFCRASSAAPDREPMKAQVLEVLRTKRVDDQSAGHPELLPLVCPQRRGQPHGTVIADGHQSSVEQGVKVRSEQQAVEHIKALFVGLALRRWANVRRPQQFG